MQRPPRRGGHERDGMPVAAGRSGRSRKGEEMAVGFDDSERIAPSALFGGTVESVMATPRIAPPPATLEEARRAPGRAGQIEALTRRIESEGIKYVFFQQVSITGRVM